jgi:hypothetical protein
VTVLFLYNLTTVLVALFMFWILLTKFITSNIIYNNISVVVTHIYALSRITAVQ